MRNPNTKLSTGIKLLNYQKQKNKKLAHMIEHKINSYCSNNYK